MLVCHTKIGSSYPKSCTWKAQIHLQKISLIRPYWKSNQSEWSSYLSKNKIFGTKQKNPVKLDCIRKVWYLLLRAFWLLLPKFNFWKGDWALGYVSTQIWDFPNISLFPKILSLKSFGNLWGNSYTMFAILDRTFHFTCG